MSHYSTALLIKGLNNNLDIFSPGVFSTKEKAIQSLFKFLIKKGVIIPICDDCELPYEDCLCEKEKDITKWMNDTVSEIKTVEDLDKICNTYGDTYYKQNWFFKVFERQVDQEQLEE